MTDETATCEQRGAKATERLLPPSYTSDPVVAAFARGIDEMLCPTERALDAQSDVFDPWRAPTEFLPWLAYITGARTEASWDERRMRAAIDHAGYLSTRYGTPGALKYEALNVYGWEMKITDPGGTRCESATGWPEDGPLRVTLRSDVLSQEAEQVDVDAVRAQLERLVEAHIPAHLLYVVSAAFSAEVSNTKLWNEAHVSVSDAEPETDFTVVFYGYQGGETTTETIRTDIDGVGELRHYYSQQENNHNYRIAVYPTDHPEITQTIPFATLPLIFLAIDGTEPGASVTVGNIDPDFVGTGPVDLLVTFMAVDGSTEEKRLDGFDSGNYTGTAVTEMEDVQCVKVSQHARRIQPTEVSSRDVPCSPGVPGSASWGSS
ncbi:phage tail protein [Streptomyces sp. NPDC092307]|uniref:phage tail protein n=1 Tax=Streptomyces sp. NPDC092307 TaxID=3366013 RepID=UPI00381ECBCF